MINASIIITKIIMRAEMMPLVNITIILNRAEMMPLFIIIRTEIFLSSFGSSTQVAWQFSESEDVSNVDIRTTAVRQRATALDLRTSVAKVTRCTR